MYIHLLLYCSRGAIRLVERPACYYNDTREHTYFSSPHQLCVRLIHPLT